MPNRRNRRVCAYNETEEIFESIVDGEGKFRSVCDRPIGHALERPSDEERGNGGGGLMGTNRARDGVERRRGKGGGIGAWILWEREIGLYDTEDVGWMALGMEYLPRRMGPSQIFRLLRYQ